MKLENEILYVEMVEHGAELTRIYNKKTGAEILWNADPKFWKRHSPVLFPNVGKTWHNVVKIQGEQYPTSQHGFARMLLWHKARGPTSLLPKHTATILLL